MSAEKNKAIVKKWEDAVFSCDAEKIKKTAKAVFAPEFFMNYETRTADKEGEHWAEMTKDSDPNELERKVKVVHRIGEGDYVLSFLEMVFRYKDKTWNFPISRFVQYKIQNGEIVEYRAANNRSGLQRRVDDGDVK